MNEHDETPGPPDLGALLTDAVADVEPADRLAEIRTSTARARRTRRTWYAGGGTLVAAAATVAAIAVIGPGDDSADPDPAEPTAVEDTTTTTAVYYLGPPPDGPDAPEAVLYRYFAPATGPLPLLMTTPVDPDYRTLWPEGSLVEVSRADGIISVVLADDSLRLRPEGVTAREAELAVEQVVYTVQAHYDQRLPVQFRANGNPIDQVFGVPTTEPIVNGQQLDVLSQMSISDPAEGETYSGSFTARGASNGVEANVVCTIDDGPDQLGAYVGTAEGWLEPRLFEWELEVDLADVPPGTYTFTCATDDPSGGAEGEGAATDTRTITVE